MEKLQEWWEQPQNCLVFFPASCWFMFATTSAKSFFYFWHWAVPIFNSLEDKTWQDHITASKCIKGMHDQACLEPIGTQDYRFFLEVWWSLDTWNEFALQNNLATWVVPVQGAHRYKKNSMMSIPLAAIRINRVPRIEMLFCLKQLDQLKTWWPHRNHYGPTDTCRPNPSLHVFAQLEMAQSGSVHASSWCLVRTCQQPQYPNARMSSLFWGADSADSSSSIVKTSWHWVVQLHHHRTKPLSEPCKLRSCVLMKLLNLNLIDIWVCLKMGHQTSSGLGKSCSLLTYIKNNHYYIWDHLGVYSL